MHTGLGAVERPTGKGTAMRLNWILIIALAINALPWIALYLLIRNI